MDERKSDDIMEKIHVQVALTANDVSEEKVVLMDKQICNKDTKHSCIIEGQNDHVEHVEATFVESADKQFVVTDNQVCNKHNVDTCISKADTKDTLYIKIEPGISYKEGPKDLVADSNEEVDDPKIVKSEPKLSEGSNELSKGALGIAGNLEGGRIMEGNENCNQEKNNTEVAHPAISLNIEVDTDGTKNMKQRTEDVIENMQYRLVHVDSDDSNRDGSDDSSSSSSSSSSDDDNSDKNDKVEHVKVKVKKKTARPEDDDEDDENDDEKTDRQFEGPPKTKGEFTVQDLPALEDLTIQVDDTVVMQEVGHVCSIVGTLVIVQANRTLPALNDDSVLFLDGKKVLGQVFEVFGPVPAPLYAVRFNTVNGIHEKGILEGMPVFYAPEEQWLTNYVFVEQLRRMKGTDASWEHNNEPPIRFLDFSDDEQEKKAKAKRRGRDTGAKEENQQESQGKKKRMGRQQKQQTGEAGPPNPPTEQWERQSGSSLYNKTPFNRNPFDHMHYGRPPMHVDQEPRFSRHCGPPPSRPFTNSGPRPPRFGQVPCWGQRHQGQRPFMSHRPRGFMPDFHGIRPDGPVFRNRNLHPYHPEQYWQPDVPSGPPPCGPERGHYANVYGYMEGPSSVVDNGHYIEGNRFTVSNQQNSSLVLSTQTGAGASKPIIMDNRFINNPR